MTEANETKERILMIDDQKQPNFFYKFGESGDEKYQEADVVIARTYKDGMKLLQEQKWDLVLLDHDLGGAQTGYDIVNWLEANPEKCPAKVGLITFNTSAGFKMEQALLKMEERGVTKYVGWQWN